MNSIQLVCRSKYVSWQVCKIEFKNAFTNTILEYYVVYAVFSCLLVFLIFFLSYLPLKPSKNTIWCTLDYIIRFLLDGGVLFDCSYDLELVLGYK
jgi:hypothetical protein